MVSYSTTITDDGEEETIQYYESDGIKSKQIVDEVGTVQETIEYYDCGEVKSKVN